MNKFKKLTLIVAVCILSLAFFVACDTNKNKEDKEKQNQKQNSLAYGSILSTRNNISFTTLKTQTSGLKEMLKDFWDIDDKSTAIDTLNWLVEEGHRTDADEVLAVIKSGDAVSNKQLKSAVDLCNKATSTMKLKLNFTDEMFKNVKTTTAWDSDRLVNVARWCYSADYITEEEAWDYIEKAVAMTKSSLNSWEEYYISFAYGRAIAYEGDIDEIIEAGETLFKKKDSILKKVAFK
ncbi:DUF1266 domain-containing protein [Desnuesiella massiliensis]|uniref:DUF1266 domain-containing protein n=1 Tax=Desnuesiella massiliensis TaxID=1650662 RepID=UPI0006E37672|nr:DUF1266 domain-containing protein [Desnuesiella massiliensis]